MRLRKGVEDRLVICNADGRTLELMGNEHDIRQWASVIEACVQRQRAAVDGYVAWTEAHRTPPAPGMVESMMKQVTSTLKLPSTFGEMHASPEPEVESAVPSSDTSTEANDDAAEEPAQVNHGGLVSNTVSSMTRSVSSLGQRVGGLLGGGAKL